MTFALLKNEDKIVRIVGECSLDDTYTIMENYLEKYDPELAKVISQNAVEIIDRNTNLLDIELKHRQRKTKTYFYGKRHFWEHNETVIQILVYASEKDRDQGESLREKNYAEFNMFDLPNDSVYKPIYKLRAIQNYDRSYSAILRVGAGYLINESPEKFDNPRSALEEARKLLEGVQYKRQPVE